MRDFSVWEPTLAKRIDEACDRFEAAWRDGQKPLIDDYVCSFASDEVTTALRELLVIDIELRKTASEPLTPSDYLDRYPAFSTTLAAIFKQESLFQHDCPEVQAEKRSLDSTADGLPQSFGDYELLSELGRGGMAVVYKARSRTLKRIVAIKMLLSGKLASTEEIDRFRSEASAAALLNHPNIVRLYEFGECEGRLFFSLEFIEGDSLAKRLMSGPLELREAAELTRRIALALAFAHGQGVIHRDLKPSNILIDRVGRPWITDFGLAKCAEGDSQLTATGQVLGTPAYMPPEQAEARSADIGATADIYSLGATLYSLLTGRPPFQAARMVDTIRQVIERDPVPPRLLNPDIDVDLQTICLKCLEKRPVKRFATALELADELGRYLAGEPIRSRPIGLVARTARWCRRRPLHAALGVAVVLLVFLSFVGLYAQIRLTAAQQLADTHQFYSFTQRMRSQLNRPDVGWSQQFPDDLRTAATLRIGNAGATELRSLAARSEAILDVKRVSLPTELKDAKTISAVAVSHDGSLFALADSKGTLSCSIFLYDTQTRKLVRECRADNTWNSLDKIRDGELVKFQDGFRCVDFSPDGRWLAASTRHGQLHLWDLRSDQASPTRTWAPHTKDFSLRFAPDSQSIYTTQVQETDLKVWNLGDGTQKQVRPPAAHEFAFSPDGRWLATGTNLLKLYDVETHTPLRYWPKHAIGALSFSADSRVLSISGEGGRSMQVVAVPSGRPIKKLTLDVGFDSSPHLSPTGNWLFTSCSDECVRIWDVNAGKVVLTIPVPGSSAPLTALSPDGKQLLVATRQGGVLYEILYPTAYQLTPPATAEIIEFGISPAGDSVAILEQEFSGNRTGDSAILRVQLEQNRLDTSSFMLLDSKDRYPARVTGSVTYSAEGDELFVTSAWGGWTWQRQSLSGRPSEWKLGPALDCAKIIEEHEFFDPASDAGGTTPPLPEVRDDPLAADGRALRIPALGSARFRLTPADLEQLQPGCWCVALVRVEGVPGQGKVMTSRLYGRKDGVESGAVLSEQVTDASYQFMVLQGESLSLPEDRKNEFVLRLSAPRNIGAVALWVDHVVVLKLARPFNATNKDAPLRFASRSNLCYAPSRQQLWGIVDGNQVVAWDAATLKQLANCNNSTMESLRGEALHCLAPGTHWVLAATRRGDVAVIRADDAKLSNVLFCGRGSTETMALLPDERVAILASENGEIRFISIPDGKVLSKANLHRERISSLAVSRDGKVVITGSNDRSIKFWSREDFRLIEQFTIDDLPAGVRTLRLSADQNRLAVLLEREKILRVWDLNKLRVQLRRLSPSLDW